MSAAGTLDLIPGSTFRTPRSFSFHRFGCDAEFFQLRHDLAAQAVQFADRQHHFAGQMILQFAEFERRAAEPAELFAQSFVCQRLLSPPWPAAWRIQLSRRGRFVARISVSGLPARP